MMAVLQIENWNHVSPILLPFESSSAMTCIVSGSLGVLIPALVFVIFMFNHLHSVWMENVKSHNENSLATMRYSHAHNELGDIRLGHGVSPSYRNGP